VVFFAVYAGLVNNQRFSRFVRYNAMQSILLDIVLVRRPLPILRTPLSAVSALESLRTASRLFLGTVHCAASTVQPA